MTHLFWLSDDAWAAIEPHLPQGKPGKPRVDDRRVISGILHVLKTGCRWRDCPSKYGPHTTIYNRYNRWSKRRIWQRIFEKMAAAGPVPEELCIDTSDAAFPCCRTSLSSKIKGGGCGGVGGRDEQDTIGPPSTKVPERADN